MGTRITIAGTELADGDLYGKVEGARISKPFFYN